ncbi:hypothetical protein N836_11710 [Leptolyngbya sp. Heron Island J]|nr:hypothetical protein [Leptolyngbya sp. Heron Island J]ESA35366.1 hypothetical protein N836_11710 [Leptolyngbya sp. Heron Island J]
MSGVELIIFWAGPAVGLAISLAAWLYEGHATAHGNSSQPNHDSV